MYVGDQRVTKEDLLLNSWYTYLRLNNFSYENRDCVVGFGRYLIVFCGIWNNSLKSLFRLVSAVTLGGSSRKSH